MGNIQWRKATLPCDKQHRGRAKGWCYLCEHIDEVSSNAETLREFVMIMINKAVAVSIFNRSSMVTDLKNLKGAQMICTGW